jgi:hypothetical protein
MSCVSGRTQYSIVIHAEMDEEVTCCQKKLQQSRLTEERIDGRLVCIFWPICPIEESKPASDLFGKLILDLTPRDRRRRCTRRTHDKWRLIYCLVAMQNSALYSMTPNMGSVYLLTTKDLGTNRIRTSSCSAPALLEPMSSCSAP